MFIVTKLLKHPQLLKYGFDSSVDFENGFERFILNLCICEILLNFIKTQIS